MVLKTVDRSSLEQQFQTYVQQWKTDCVFLSSTSAMVAHPAYKAIIELGEPAVPLLLRELESEPAHWFEALKSNCAGGWIEYSAKRAATSGPGVAASCGGANASCTPARTIVVRFGALHEKPETSAGTAGGFGQFAAAVAANTTNATIAACTRQMTLDIGLPPLGRARDERANTMA